MKTIAEEFTEQAIFRMNENTPKIKKCLQKLTEEEVWQRPNKSSNSVGNLILHLCGNIRQYIISSIGEKADTRERDLEFSTREGFTKNELLERLTTTVEEAINIIKSITESDLMKRRSVQGFDSSSLGNILQVVEHYSYHTGQIIFWTKLLKDKDLGFYAHVDLNKKNIV